MTVADDLLSTMPAIQNAVDELLELYAQLAHLQHEFDDLVAVHEVAAARNVTLQATIDTQVLTIKSLRARIAELEAIVNPPPTTVLDWGPEEPSGGGGPNAMCVLDDGSVLVGWDVAGLSRHVIGEGGHKCNLGLPERHVAGITKLSGNRALVVTGTVGRKDQAVRIYYGDTHKCGPSHTSQFTVRSQNSAGWGADVGHAYMRSTGRLIEMRPNGDLVCGEFSDGVGVWSAASKTKRTVPGTEGWNVRSLVADPDLEGCYLVCVWGFGVWTVDVNENNIQREHGLPFAERAVLTQEGYVLTACRDDGIHWGPKDITYDLPRAAWWFRVREKADGTIQALSCKPKPFKGAPCNVVELKPGATSWDNLSANPDFIDGTTGKVFWRALDAPQNMMGGKDAKMVEVDTLADGSDLALGGGILWNRAGGRFHAQNSGCGIIVMRSAAWSEEFRCAAFAVMDYKVLVRFGDEPWKRETAGLGGSGDGAAVEFVGNLLYLKNSDGTVWCANLAVRPLQWRRAVDPMPVVPPSVRLRREGGRVFFDDKDITTPALTEFGTDVSGLELIDGDPWVFGHGVISYRERSVVV